ncbi:MAG: DNA alkylation repair protein [Arcobacteraceae bacterium]|nr:DNA alkylation repair protein [Arcobacteraceae bacterium]
MEPFKNIYNKTEIVKLANEIAVVYPPFELEQFISYIIDDVWEQKELKERLRTITLGLGEFLPTDYLESLEILKKVHHKFNGLFHLIFPDFVEVYGLEYYEDSIEALKLFTQNCSSEFAIRPFLVKYPQLIETLKEWTKDENEHVRRLVSEGSRPRLPWGMALQNYKKEPIKVIELLELLKDDESEYVRKSVANNLNDISKDNPKVVKEVLKQWYGKSKNRDWIVKHAARTLLKAGDKEVMEIFGYRSDDIEVIDLIADDKIKMEEYLNFSFTIQSKKTLGKLRIEYKLGLVRQNEKMGYKVFKISEKEVSNTKLSVKKAHHFKYVTTRKYYDGIHTLIIIINGKEFLTKNFELEGCS